VGRGVEWENLLDSGLVEVTFGDNVGGTVRFVVGDNVVAGQLNE